MLVPGAATNPWEMLSPLQPLQWGNAGAAAAGIGSGQFLTEEAAPAASGQLTAPPTGTNGQASFSPGVLGYLIWNQSQQPGSTSAGASGANASATSATNGSAGATTGTNGATGTSAIPTFNPWQSWFSPLGSTGNGMTASSAPDAAVGTNGGSSTSATPPNQGTPTGNALTLGNEPDAPWQRSGMHGHGHHHASFAAQPQSNGSNPLANLLGSSAQGASSTTATNSNGSTTTTITYADGSEVTLTTPAQSASNNANPTTASAQPPVNSNNFLETLIQLQAQLLSSTSAA